MGCEARFQARDREEAEFPSPRAGSDPKVRRTPANTRPNVNSLPRFPETVVAAPVNRWTERSRKSFMTCWPEARRVYATHRSSPAIRNRSGKPPIFSRAASTREVALEFGEGGELEPLGGMVVELSSKDTEHPLDKIDLVKIRDSVIRGHDRHGRIPSEVVDRTRDPIRAVEHNVLVKGEHEFATGFAEPVVQGLREPQVRFVADQPARW